MSVQIAHVASSANAENFPTLRCFRRPINERTLQCKFFENKINDSPNGNKEKAKLTPR